MRNVEVLNQCYWPELHRLMVLQDFPEVPIDYEEAERYFEDVEIFCLLKEGRLKAAFIFGSMNGDSAFIDVVCSPDYKGIWATPAVLKALHDLAFEHFALDYVWCQPKNKVALKAALQAGFVCVTQMDMYEPVLVLTRNNLIGIGR